MEKPIFLESEQNPRIKNILKLQEKAKERKLQNLFVVEGVQENRLALEAHYEIKTFYICEAIFEAITFKIPANVEIVHVSKNVFEKIAYRKTTGGIIGVYTPKNNNLANLNAQSIKKIIVLEAVEKPGNLGAILRTADAAKVDALVVCDALTDFYNPNVIRSSVGCVFTNQLIIASAEEIANYLKTNKIQIVATFLNENTQNLYQTDLSKPSAIILGTEATGLSPFWETKADVCVKIPMLGSVDSLNVSNAAAICVFEMTRQQDFLI